MLVYNWNTRVAECTTDATYFSDVTLKENERPYGSHSSREGTRIVLGRQRLKLTSTKRPTPRKLRSRRTTSWSSSRPWGGCFAIIWETTLTGHTETSMCCSATCVRDGWNRLSCGNSTSSLSGVQHTRFHVLTSCVWIYAVNVADIVVERHQAVGMMVFELNIQVSMPL